MHEWLSRQVRDRPLMYVAVCFFIGFGIPQLILFLVRK